MAKRPKKQMAVNSGVNTSIAKTGTGVRWLPSWFSREWVLGLILLFAVILTYQPVWYAGFNWDDNLLVTANLCIVGPLGLKEIWTTNAADICPLVLTTFWMEHALLGLRSLPYHLVNVLMHGACAVLLWRVLRSLQVPGAWLGATLWALHPVQVESVAWVTELKNTQSGLFYLLTILFFVKGLRAKDAREQSGWNWNYALTFLFAALAMASKSSTVVLPIVLCLCAWWVEGRWRRHNMAKLAPIFLMSFVASVVSIWTQKLALATFADSQWARSWPERLVTAGDAVWFYLGKLLWPHPLIAIYPRWQVDASQWVSYFPLLAVIIGLFVFWLRHSSGFRPYFFAFAYFLVTLLPALGLVDNYIFRYSLVFDHFQYLASMGPLALAGAGLARLLDYIIPGRRWLQSTFYAGLLLILGMLSWQRSWAYSSEETLWADTLAKNPNCWMGYCGLGAALAAKGQVDEAIEQYHKALEINPNYILARNNLGIALAQKGQVDEAIEQFRKALKIDSNDDEAYYCLGLALAKKGQVNEAIVDYQKALRINPNLVEARNNIGLALFQLGQVDDAIEQYQKAVAFDPDFTEAYNNLGSAFSEKGQVDEAIEAYQKALKINPSFTEAYNNLGNALSKEGQVDAAIEQYKKALEINPNYADSHYNLGNALLQKGQVDGAIEEYQKALEINPDYAEAHINFGTALLQKRLVNEAIEQYQEALRLKPESKAAQDNLVKAKARQKAAQK